MADELLAFEDSSPTPTSYLLFMSGHADGMTADAAMGIERLATTTGFHPFAKSTNPDPFPAAESLLDFHELSSGFLGLRQAIVAGKMSRKRDITPKILHG